MSVVILGFDSLFQAKNEPTGKKTSEKREGEGKKEKSSTSDRYCSAPRELWPRGAFPVVPGKHVFHSLGGGGSGGAPHPFLS